MNKENIYKILDHTCLKVDSTWEDIKKVCINGAANNVASVCIPPCYVKQAAEYIKDTLKSNLRVCTVIGFPNGYSTAETKAYEACDAITNGAKEIDFVINIGYAKANDFHNGILEEVLFIKKRIEKFADSCMLDLDQIILKMIIETCQLSKKDMKTLCDIAKMANIDFVKTSTGFNGKGAVVKDVELLVKELEGSGIKVKASGGIHTLEEAQSFIDAGASRIGASSLL